MCTQEPHMSKVSSEFCPYLHFSYMQQPQQFIRSLKEQFTVKPEGTGQFINFVFYFADIGLQKYVKAGCFIAKSSSY